MIASYKTKSPKGVISDLVVNLVAKSCLTLVTPWTIACQAPASIFKQEDWSGLPFPPPEDLPDPGNGPRFLALQADSLPTELQGKPQSDIHSVVSTLCNPKDYTVHGVLQARILEWVAAPFSRESSQPRDRTRSPTLQADYLPPELPGKPSLVSILNKSQYFGHVWILKDKLAVNVFLTKCMPVRCCALLLLFQTPVVLLLTEPRVGKVSAKRLEGNSSQPAGGAVAAAETFLLFRLARQPYPSLPPGWCSSLSSGHNITLAQPPAA